MIVIGINPGVSRDPRSIRRGSALHRLCEWATAAGLERFSFVNCFYDTGPYTMSRVEWDFLRDCLDASEGARVVALGAFPSRVLSFIGIGHETIPHPSGLNRLINDPREVKRAIGVLRGVDV